MAPVLRALDASSSIEHFVCNTGQHRDLLQPFLDLFDVEIAYNLEVMKEGQSLAFITSEVLCRLGPVIDALAPP